MITLKYLLKTLQTSTDSRLNGNCKWTWAWKCDIDFYVKEGCGSRSSDLTKISIGSLWSSRTFLSVVLPFLWSPFQTWNSTPVCDYINGYIAQHYFSFIVRNILFFSSPFHNWPYFYHLKLSSAKRVFGSFTKIRGT